MVLDGIPNLAKHKEQVDPEVGGEYRPCYPAQ
jgi:hypothetical protein